MLELIAVRGEAGSSRAEVPKKPAEVLSVAIESINDLRGTESRYLPVLTSTVQDLPYDMFRRLYYLSRINPASVHSPFTQEQEQVIRRSYQASRNTNICLRYGFISFCIFSSLGGASSFIGLTSLSRGAQALLSCCISSTNACVTAELGLQYGGRNTNGSSDRANEKQDIVDAIKSEYVLLGKYLLKVYIKGDERMKAFAVSIAKGTYIERLKEQAVACGTPAAQADAIFKFFQGSICHVNGTPWQNSDVEDFVNILLLERSLLK